MRSFGSVKVFYPRYDRDEVIRLLRLGAEQLRAVLPLQRLVLFGSYASGRYTAASDIDVLVVYAGEPRADAFRTVHEELELHGLEPHIYTSDEARELTDTLARMTADGVSIFERGDRMDIETKRQELGSAGIDQALLRDVCRGLGVRLAVLFGSRATGSPPPGPESDIDVAVLPSRQEEPPSLWKCHRELAPAFAEHSLDLVLLHDADPLLRWEVMERGVLLYGDADEFMEHRAFAYRDFIDSADLRALEHDLFLKKMAHIRQVLDAAS